MSKAQLQMKQAIDNLRREEIFAEGTEMVLSTKNL